MEAIDSLATFLPLMGAAGAGVDSFLHPELPVPAVPVFLA